MQDALKDLPPFLTRLFHFLDKNQIDASKWPLDHVCYRVATEAAYRDRKHELHSMGSLLAESPIGGRLIATYRLKEAVHYQGRLIKLIELPSPKVGSPYPEGWEHAEFVLDIPFAEFLKQYPSLPFEMRGSHKPLNPEIGLKGPDCAVKFHSVALDKVIEMEKALDCASIVKQL